jgi:hypothetical protein
MAGGASLAPKAVVVGGGGHGGAQQRPILVQGADGGGTEHQELGVGVRGIARIKQAAQLGIADGVVEVLARAVDAGKGLLVQQADHAVALGHAAQGGHHQLVVVGGQVALLIDGGDFELAGATSLWRVLTGTPSLNSSRSTSIMKERTRRGITPKYWSSNS